MTRRASFGLNASNRCSDPAKPAQVKHLERTPQMGPSTVGELNPVGDHAAGMPRSFEAMAVRVAPRVCVSRAPSSRSIASNAVW
ncbi:hypothetical protein DM49_3602 [Burkholderia mallei]|nr:hypothetical protein DM49_3602 [Burkholderia mallei]